MHRATRLQKLQQDGPIGDRVTIPSEDCDPNDNPTSVLWITKHLADRKFT
jgi:hypothetical protein